MAEDGHVVNNLDTHLVLMVSILVGMSPPLPFPVTVVGGGKGMQLFN